MKEEQKLSEYTKKVWGIADAIALVLLIEGAFMFLSSIIWVFTSDNTDKWFTRISMGLICYGFAGIIFRLRKQPTNTTKDMEWIEVKIDNHELEGAMWVKCIAEIRKNDTGEIREYETYEILKIGSEHPNIFSWEVSNFSCDCNRLLFFKSAGNEEDEEDWDVDCTHGKFSVNLKNKKDGKVYYREYGA